MTNRTAKLLESLEQPQRPVATLIPALPVPRPGSTSHTYLQLVHRLVQLRQEQNHGSITAFTSAKSGEGVTHVIESLAWELAKHSGEQILLTTGYALTCPPVHPLWNRDDAISHRVHRLVEGRASEQRPLQSLRWQDLRGLRERFGFVLVDCPAIQKSSAILTLGRTVDGVVLVVAADETKRDDVRLAQQALAASSTKLLGLVLNKRKNPIPGAISRLL
jgi:Mrp family chromosome partitioning ATPase